MADIIWHAVPGPWSTHRQQRWVKWSDRMDINSSSLLCTYLFEKTKQDVCMDRTFMGFIQHYDSILSEIRINETLSQHHTICHVLYDSLWTCQIFKTYCITNLDKMNIKLLCKFNQMHMYCCCHNLIKMFTAYNKNYLWAASAGFSNY